MTFELSLSVNYVKDWGLWEAVRELCQNAYDQTDRDPECKCNIEYRNNCLLIKTSTGHLEPRTLLLGETDKTDQGLRGKFGEGYKLALLVLCRMGLTVRIKNGDEEWIPKIVHSQTFGTEVLSIEIVALEFESSGVSVSIEGIDLQTWESIAPNLWSAVDKTDSILFAPGEKGRIYVGGLFVTKFDELEYGYSFLPSTVPLDRDRKMVNTYDIATATSLLWMNRQNNDPEQRLVYKLLAKNAFDVRYVAYRMYNLSEHSLQSVYASYVANHGVNTVPVTNQTEIQKVQDAGLKWTLVPECLHKLLQVVKKWVIPSTNKSPVQRLQDFYEANRHAFTEANCVELKDIIKTLESSRTLL